VVSCQQVSCKLEVVRCKIVIGFGVRPQRISRKEKKKRVAGSPSKFVVCPAGEFMLNEMKRSGSSTISNLTSSILNVQVPGTGVGGVLNVLPS